MKYNELKREIKIAGFAQYNDSPIMVYINDMKPFSSNDDDLDRYVGKMTWNQFEKLIDEKILITDKFREYAIVAVNLTSEEIAQYI